MYQLKFCDLRTFLNAQLNRYSDQTFVCMIQESCLIRGREKSFPQLQTVYTVCGAYPAFFPAVKRPQLEADHSI